jgi:hypothetical protein
VTYLQDAEINMFQVKKLAIIGARDFTDYNIVKNAVLARFDISLLETIISGGAPGVDTLAERLARELGVHMTVFPADWARYGRAAGPIRNCLIVDHADFVLAFAKPTSRGTAHALAYCVKKEKPHTIIHVA